MKKHLKHSTFYLKKIISLCLFLTEIYHFEPKKHFFPKSGKKPKGWKTDKLKFFLCPKKFKAFMRHTFSKLPSGLIEKSYAIFKTRWS
jgi:hypothetical protein